MKAPEEVVTWVVTVGKDCELNVNLDKHVIIKVSWKTRVMKA
jgi:hypothetical protein